MIVSKGSWPATFTGLMFIAAILMVRREAHLCPTKLWLPVEPSMITKIPGLMVR